ncbi:MAG: hypothetical protein ACM3SY_04205 [Candidatus Omnitrophota bacterium]
MNRSTFSIKTVLLFVFVFFALAAVFTHAEIGKPRLYISFGGMATNAQGGDFGNFMTQDDAYFQSLMASSANDTTSWKKPANFLGYTGELGFETEYFSVGISAGYLKKTYHREYVHNLLPSLAVDRFTGDYTFSAIPIFLLFHYNVIRTSVLTASITVGEGVYLGTFKETVHHSYENASLTFANTQITARRNTPGFHAGTTIDIHLTRFLALSVEAAYRIVKFDSISADIFTENDKTNSTNTGTLYYSIHKQTQEPTFSEKALSTTNWNTQPAVFKLNGFSLSAGIKITFGKAPKTETVQAAPPSDID